MYNVMGYFELCDDSCFSPNSFQLILLGIWEKNQLLLIGESMLS